MRMWQELGAQMSVPLIERDAIFHGIGLDQAPTLAFIRVAFLTFSTAR